MRTTLLKGLVTLNSINKDTFDDGLSIESFTENDTMTLQNSALIQLNIIEPPHKTSNIMMHRKPKSIEGVMRHTLTKAGKREYSRRIRNPITNISEIRHRQDFTKWLIQMFADNTIETKTKVFLKDSVDLISIFNNGISKSILPIRIQQCYNTLKSCVEYRDYISKTELGEKISEFGVDSKLYDNIQSIIQYFDDTLSTRSFNN